MSRRECEESLGFDQCGLAYLPLPGPKTARGLSPGFYLASDHCEDTRRQNALTGDADQKRRGAQRALPDAGSR